MSNKAKGKLGENIAADFLLKRNHKILDRNFHYSRYGEIDIISIYDGVIYFCEVKYRTSNTFGAPLEAITHSKLLKIQACAMAYLKDFKQKYSSYKICAISILNDKNGLNIDFIEDI